MSGRSSIEWTNATWNPVRGCSIVSPGCTNCYAMRQAHRQSGKGKAYEGLTKLTKGGPVWTGNVRAVPELLDEPLGWRKPRRIFVNSMSDLFHEDVPDEFIAAVFGVMAQCPQHTFQILSKRPARMRAWLSGETKPNHASLREWCFYAAQDKVGRERMSIKPWSQEWPLRHLWLGVSVERQQEADERIPLLLQTPAAVRWISAEPLLAPLDLTAIRPFRIAASFDALRGIVPRLNWVVVGGESGPGARPMHPDWARSLRDQCARAPRTPFFFKQWGAWTPCSREADHKTDGLYVRFSGGTHRLSAHELYDDSDAWVNNVGKKRAGRVLDGRTHDDYPA